MNNLKEIILKNKPELSSSSIKTYLSSLSGLHKKLFEGDIKLSNFQKTKIVLNSIKNKLPSQRKSILNVLYVLTKDEEYHKLMMEDIISHNNLVKSGEMNDKQKSKMITQEELKIIFENVKQDANEIYKKTNKSKNDIQVIQNYVILALTSGLFFNPRRLLDWTQFKNKNIDIDNDNYMNKDEFIFNKYKNSKSKGQQRLEIPKIIKNILKNWAKINDNDYLLIDTLGNKLNSTKLNQRLTKILRNRSMNSLRHSYFTNDKNKNLLKKYQILKDDFNKSGSSIEQADVYINKEQ